MAGEFSFTTAVVGGAGATMDDPTRPADEAPTVGEAELLPPHVVPAPREPLALPSQGVDLTATPKATAFLYVADEGTGNRYVVWGQCGDPTLPKEERELVGQEFHAPTEALLGSFSTPAKVQKTMSEYSVKHPLRRWLKRLREHFEDELCMVIVDRSRVGIPWEFFTLKNTDHAYLGASVDTVRWVDVEDDEGENVEQRFSEDLCEGAPLSHIDASEQQAVAAEHQLLAQFGCSAEGDIRVFHDRIKQRARGYALVYLLCHGFIGKSVLHIQLGSRNETSKRLELAQLRQQRLALLEESRSIVFINACSSGVITQDTTVLNDEVQRGFAELFLGKGARGVLGTLGSVKARRAAEFANRFLQTTLAKDQPIARTLRELRAEVAKRMPDEPTAEQYEELYTVLLYVYYGNPRTRLRLRTATGEGP